uniref:PID domain-containing protein n=1 Tax=Meloidogyne hapla TaxID=6305 RepID=A0A1I8BKP3_MELHA
MEVYKTIKRSVSSKATSIIGSSRFSNQNSFVPEPKTEPIYTWIHPPDLLIKGRVEYTVKMLGHVDVSNSKGTAVVQDAIAKLRLQALTKQNETGQIPKSRKVVLQINVNEVNVIDLKTRGIQFKKKMLTYIAKNDVDKLQCFVFLSDKMAENIEQTICQAFDLTLERYAKKKARSFEDQNQIILLLRKKVSELEEYNAQLEAKMARCHCGQGAKDLLIPLSPIPPIPPNNTETLPNIYLPSFPSKSFSSPPPLPLAPPPRRSSTTQNDTNKILAEIFEQQQKQNGQLSAPPKDLFDNDFDPRANEKKILINQNNGVIQSEEPKKTATQDLEELLHRLDFQMKEVTNDDQFQLERGDIGDAGKDWPENQEEEENEEHYSQLAGPSPKN